MSQTAASPPRPLERRYHGSANIRDYEIDQKLGEGTFGEVYKARCKKTHAVVALKKILMHNEKDGFPITALREIKLLKMLSHINVIKLEEMAVERTKEKKRATLYMVTPYMEHDLSGLLDNRDVQITVPMVKCYMLQLLRGLRYLHNSNILHRDMKAANLLISNSGILKIADFGLARHYDEPIPQPGRGNGEAHRDYTTLVVTRWYRPPELLLQLRRYTPAIDMWGAGCVFGEMFKRKPILAGKSDVNQAEIIFELVGSPNEQTMPGWKELPGCEGVKQWDKKPGSLGQVFGQYGEDAVSLLRELLTLDWRKRINAVDAMQHPYFKNRPLPAQPHEIPHFADSHELDRRNGRGAHQELPPAPPGGTVGGGPNGEWAGQNGDHWGNGSRPRYPPGAGPAHSRVPQAAYDGRGPPPPPPRDDRRHNQRYGDAPPVRAPHHLPPPPDGLRHALPPRPDLPPGSDLPPRPPRDNRERDRDRGDRDRRGGGGGHRKPAAANIDTYVPDYSGGGPRSRDGRASMDRDDRYSGRPVSRGDDRAPRRRDYDDPDRPLQRRTRSRSPERRERDRERDRENVYRR